MTDAQRKAAQKYKADKTRSIRLELNVNTDADVIARLDQVENRQGYVKRLIREDIGKTE